MLKTTSLRAVLLGVTAVLAACSSDNGGITTGPMGPNVSTSNPGTPRFETLVKDKRNATIVTGTVDITSAVEDFRSLLGTPNNLAVANDQGAGRREINWDGVPPNFTNNGTFPGDFFNKNSKRGLVTTTDGTGFEISNQSFIELNPAYAGEFNTFSPTKLFVATGSTVVDVKFFVAGTSTPAVTTGFGSVFADVGRQHSTVLEFFDANDHLLLKVAAPEGGIENGLSFAGAVFTSPVVARVRITSGDTPMGADAFDNVKGAGPKRDIVAMDDFFYGEPHAIN
jgi:hypothetical protein